MRPTDSDFANGFILCVLVVMAMAWVIAIARSTVREDAASGRPVFYEGVEYRCDKVKESKP